MIENGRYPKNNLLSNWLSPTYCKAYSSEGLKRRGEYFEDEIYCLFEFSQLCHQALDKLGGDLSGVRGSRVGVVKKSWCRLRGLLLRLGCLR